DFDEDIYGKSLRVFVLEYLRGEKKFNGLDELKNEIDNDKKLSLAFFNKKPNK
ncbi:MAG: hypothetical protein EOP04_13580, partial [Proteobacteria bacterium]